jgi:hypothetical protein
MDISEYNWRNPFYFLPRQGRTFRCHVSVGNSLGRAILGTLLADPAKSLHAEGPISVTLKRKICKNFTQAHARPEFFRDEKTHTTALSQSRSHGKGNTQRRIISGGNRTITEAADKACHHVGHTGHVRVPPTRAGPSHTGKP